MSRRIATMGVLGLGLVLLLAAAAAAQGPLPGAGPRHGLALSSLPPAGFSAGGAPRAPAGDSPVAAPPAGLALGEAGLSFRYTGQYGVTGEPYVADMRHLNAPNGLTTDAAGNLYIAEEWGQRVLAFDAAGNGILTIGHAGFPWQWGDYVAWPKDVALDGSGSIWVLMEHAVKEFDSAGNPVLTFPGDAPWENGDTEDRFKTPRGLAFDSAGRLYIADSGNQRVQVFSVSEQGLVYSTTIGVTGDARSDNTGFNDPEKVDFDTLGRLYVLDTGNHRVQRCSYSSGHWICSTFIGETGMPGADLAHLNWPVGLALDTSGVYIADGNNLRVLKCPYAGACSLFAGVTGVAGSDNAHYLWPTDVAVDSSGNVYVSDWDNQRVQKYNSTGRYLRTLGATRQPYALDRQRLNTPWGVAAAPDGGVYVTENRGFRLLKLAADGSQQWVVGQAGIYGADNAHLGSWWAGLEGNPAVDAAGRIYVADTGNNRVQIFNPDGSYYATLGGEGDGNGEFHCPVGVAISPVNGDIVVTDQCNQRVQVFDSSRAYKATIGVLHETGEDNQHFNWPRGGTAVGADGAIYVPDSDNFRVQRCAGNGGTYSCTTFLGQTGEYDRGLSYLHPRAVAVDNEGRVYVADDWNKRLQVFDAAGAYLTTIGGNTSSGTKSGQMYLNSPLGVAVGSDGTVYVADTNNHRITRFAPGVPYWRQENLNGFGDPYDDFVQSVAPLGDYLYAAVNNETIGAELWRSDGQHPFTLVRDEGFGYPYNVYIDSLVPFSNVLYASTGTAPWLSGEDNGGEIWRSSPEGFSWSRVVSGGFDDPKNNEINHMHAFEGHLYAGTYMASGGDGCSIWRSGTGDAGSWEAVASDGFDDDAHNQGTAVFDEYGGYLYVGTWNYTTGTELWRSASGDTGTWEQVSADGFGSPSNIGISGLTAFRGYFYAATGNHGGGQLWRCQACDGSDWSRATEQTFGRGGWGGFTNLVAHDGSLYAVAANDTTGVQVWHSPDGQTWHRELVPAGFGDSNNVQPYEGSSTLVWGDRLWVGTHNTANGGELWSYGFPVAYLPMAVRP